ncbi:PAS domain-containing protein [Aliikangiella sp. G2MR2-5]|uniref:PAS domain-containing protein n=1 Tax=Aliikangiella sp. G2MR2-5 TaxID=2788943 RepID=UPI0018A95564|nr:PAS domain-containing protein [Aliikangiella sp. G2MR2-5]
MEELLVSNLELSEFDLVTRSLEPFVNLELNQHLIRHCIQTFQPFEKSDQLMVLLNLKGEIVYINGAGCDQLGLSQQALIGSCWFTQFIPSEQRTEILMVFDNITNGTGELYSEYINDIVIHDNQQITYSWKNRFITNEMTQVTGVFSIGLGLKFF